MCPMRRRSLACDATRPSASNGASHIKDDTIIPCVHSGATRRGDDSAHLSRLPLSRYHIATEGENLTGFYNALLVHASTTEEVDIKPAVPVRYNPFSYTGRMRVTQRRIKFKHFLWQSVPVNVSWSLTSSLRSSPLLLK